MSNSLIEGQLEPFGRTWTPSEGCIDMEYTLAGDLRGLVMATREAGVLVMNNSVIGDGGHPVVAGQPGPLVAQLTRDPWSGIPPVVALHGTMQAGDIARSFFYRYGDLVAAARTNIDLLRAAVNDTTEAIRDEFRLADLLNAYESAEGFYSFDELVGPHAVMERRLLKGLQQATGSLRIVGQDLEAIAGQYGDLCNAYRGLMGFYDAIAQTAKRYTHDWGAQPNTTVLFCQGVDDDRFDHPEKQVYHAMEGTWTHGSLRSDMILGDSRRGYQAYSQMRRGSW